MVDVPHLTVTSGICDVVSIFCKRDLPFQLLQARSIARFLDRDSLGRLIYVWNEPEPQPDEALRLLCNQLGSFDFQMIQSSDLGIENAYVDENAWLTQQAAKLLVASRVETQNYMVLDAKNHFIRPCATTDFIHSDSRAARNLHELSKGGDYDRLAYALRFFGCATPATLSAVEPVTPFIFNRSIVLRMIERIEAATTGALATVFFRHDEMLSEFLCYQAFWMSEGRDPSDLFSNSGLRNREVLWGHLGRPGFFKDWLARVAMPSVKVIGVHWMACINMNREQRLALCDLWLQAGLVESKDEGLDVIDSVSRNWPDHLQERARELLT